MQHSNIDYLSGEVKEILGSSPSSVTRWAFFITAGMLVLLFFAGASFTYEEIIQGEVILTTSDPPVILASPQNGNLENILVTEGQEVSKGDVLAVFESDAELEDVLKLEEEIAALNKFELEAIRAFTPDKRLEVGELTVAYEEFISALEFVPLYEGDQIDQDAINSIQEHNRQLEQSNNSLRDAIESARNEIKSIDRLMGNVQDLYGKNPSRESLSTELLNYDNQKSEIRSEISARQAAIDKNLETIRNNNARIFEMRVNKQSGLQERIYQLRQSLAALKRAITRWKEDYLVISPADGKASLYANLVARARYSKDEPLIAIIPVTTQTTYVGHVKVPIEGSGKVKNGQEVNLKFYRYPFREFGQVKGTVSKIYPLPKGDAYSVEVALDNGLQTSAGKVLEFHQQMEGKAEIVTDKKLFISQLFDKFAGAWKS